MEAREKDDVGKSTGCFARMCTCWQALERAVMGNCWAKPGTSKSGTLTDDGSSPGRPDDSSSPTGTEGSKKIPLPPVDVGQNLRVFSYQELRAATRNFRPDSLLGEGGFGCVFKGWIDENGTGAVKPGTGLVVAVKQLNQEGLQGHKEWLAEVNFLGQLHHPNLVKLIGYCAEDDQRLLVYEFMPRGSLENHLFRKGALPLPWAVRMKIAFGAAKGLAFLHEGAEKHEKHVIYRDFKTSNILLDSDYTAKLSDFGLAKDGPEGDKTHVSTRVMGTYGYAAPEYVMTGHLTPRSDVYSFGVVLLEMLTGRKSMDKNRPSGEQNLVEWARPYLGEKRKLFRLIDPRLDGQYSPRGLQKAALLAHHCLSRDPKSRPQMGDVVDTLKPLLELKDVPNSGGPSHPHLQPLSSERSSRHHSHNGNGYSIYSSHGHHSSRNGVSRSSSGGSQVSSYANPPRHVARGP
ncbi:hypothetical protein R1flu_005551 [Riccia fluitans]|uniref:non-specific serine/threonine protein kinase n=1 Tax=Riccia fluitans TaxID=41844 RepID=A0ABD1YXH6_9MARC